VIAVDTNLLVRIIVEDDASQVGRARALINAQDRVLVLKTVLLEIGWVLATSYHLSREAIVSSIRGVLAVSNFEIEDRPAVMTALEWYQQGMDFADAMHLAALGGDTQFATFDASLRSTARRLGIARVVAI
jgi:predicted nucleic-acid-binding protein